MMQVRSAPTSDSLPRVKDGVIGIWCLVATPGLQATDLGVLRDIGHMEIMTPLARPFAHLRQPCQAEAIEVSTSRAPHVYTSGKVRQTATSGLAPGSRPASVGNSKTRTDITTFPLSSGHLNDRF